VTALAGAKIRALAKARVSFEGDRQCVTHRHSYAIAARGLLTKWGLLLAVAGSHTIDLVVKLFFPYFERFVRFIRVYNVLNR
jgi:hypothetical protein